MLTYAALWCAAVHGLRAVVEAHASRACGAGTCFQPPHALSTKALLYCPTEYQGDVYQRVILGLVLLRMVCELCVLCACVVCSRAIMEQGRPWRLLKG